MTALDVFKYQSIDQSIFHFIFHFNIDTMQNVIEQSVLDNNWQPTAESAGYTRHMSIPLAIITILPTLVRYFSNVLNLFVTISQKQIVRAAR